MREDGAIVEWHASCYKQPSSFPWRLALKHLILSSLSLSAGYDPRLSSCWHKILPLMLPREPRRGQRGRTWMNEVPMAQRPRGIPPKGGPKNSPSAGGSSVAVAALRMETLCTWAIERAEGFPRKVKFSLGDRWIDANLAVVEHLVEASYTREKAHRTFKPRIRATRL